MNYTKSNKFCIIRSGNKKRDSLQRLSLFVFVGNGIERKFTNTFAHGQWTPFDFVAEHNTVERLFIIHPNMCFVKV